MTLPKRRLKTMPLRNQAVKCINQEHSERWSWYHGDCVSISKGIPDNSIHYSIYSPPFSSLYTYSNSERDMGNSRNDGQFMEHYRFLVNEMFRITMPGRLTSFHCMNLPTSKQRDGVIGLRDFRGELIRIHVESGWIYHSEVVIWKDPVVAMQRTKALGLLHKQLKKDSCMSRQGIPDYVVTMRKPGENPERCEHTDDSFPVEIWQEYASPTWEVKDLPDEIGHKERLMFFNWLTGRMFNLWHDINPSDTLQKESARAQEDERHIAPLQLEVIKRCLQLWSKPDDVVLSPFGGIASEGFKSLSMGRKFIGIELKESYFHQGRLNLINAAQVQKDMLI